MNYVREGQTMCPYQPFPDTVNTGLNIFLFIIIIIQILLKANNVKNKSKINKKQNTNVCSTSLPIFQHSLLGYHSEFHLHPIAHSYHLDTLYK